MLVALSLKRRGLYSNSQGQLCHTFLAKHSGLYCWACDVARAGATQASPIGIKLRKTPASGSCHAAWTTPTPCQPASAAPDRGADPWDTADACPPAPVLPPVAALYWETACASQCDSPSAYCPGSL